MLLQPGPDGAGAHQPGTRGAGAALGGPGRSGADLPLLRQRAAFQPGGPGADAGGYAQKVNRNATVPREGSEGGSLPRQAFERQEAAVRMGQKQVRNRDSKKVEKNLNLGLTERGSLRIITFVV